MRDAVVFSLRRKMKRGQLWRGSPFDKRMEPVLEGAWKPRLKSNKSATEFIRWVVVEAREGVKEEERCGWGGGEVKEKGEQESVARELLALFRRVERNVMDYMLFLFGARSE